MKNIRSRIAALLCAAAMAVGLSACGVNITSVKLPETAVMNKGDTLQMEISYAPGTMPGRTPLPRPPESWIWSGLPAMRRWRRWMKPAL